jgi:NADH:ubiquinone oxidoreductase subunit K
LASVKRLILVLVESFILIDNLKGQFFSFFILAIVASKPAVGLAVIIICFRVRGVIVFMS